MMQWTVREALRKVYITFDRKTLLKPLRSYGVGRFMPQNEVPKKEVDTFAHMCSLRGSSLAIPEGERERPYVV